MPLSPDIYILSNPLVGFVQMVTAWSPSMPEAPWSPGVVVCWLAFARWAEETKASRLIRLPAES